jgi:hypothetical protein
MFHHRLRLQLAAFPWASLADSESEALAAVTYCSSLLKAVSSVSYKQSVSQPWRRQTFAPGYNTRRCLGKAHKADNIREPPLSNPASARRKAEEKEGARGV